MRELQYEMEIVPEFVVLSGSSPRNEQSILAPFIDNWWSFPRSSITGVADTALASRALKGFTSNKSSTFDHFANLWVPATVKERAIGLRVDCHKHIARC